MGSPWSTTHGRCHCSSRFPRWKTANWRCPTGQDWGWSSMRAHCGMTPFKPRCCTEASVHRRAAVDDQRLASDEVTGRRRKKHDGAHQVRRDLDTANGAILQALLAQADDVFARVFFAQRAARCDRIHADAAWADL